MKTYSITGIVLSKKDIFERDKLVELFTYEEGKKTFLAKNANTKAFRFSGTLEMSNIVNLELFKGKSFHIITAAQSIQCFNKLRTSFNHIAMASFFIELIKKATVQEQENSELYTLLVETLKRCNELLPITDIKFFFYNKFLNIEGITNETFQTIPDKTFQEYYETYTSSLIKFPILLES